MAESDFYSSVYRLAVKRSFAIMIALSVLWSSNVLGISYLAESMKSWSSRSQFVDLPEFTDSPLAAELGENPSVDPTYRNGVWDDELLAQLTTMQSYEASQLPFPEASPTVSGGGSFSFGGNSGGSGTTTTTTGTTTTGSTTGSTTGTTTGSTTGGGTGGGPSGGDKFGWEADGPGGGSPGAPGTVNTNTGNRLTEVPLVAWDCVGDLSVDFTLFHNSRGPAAQNMGNKWRSSLDLYVYQDMLPIQQGQKRTAIVRWPDGKYVPYVETGYQTDQYLPNGGGIYDKLIRNATGSYVWSIVTKDQTRYEFNSNGYLMLVKDRVGNQFTVTRSNPFTVSSVTDSSSRTLFLSYNAQNLLSQMQDPLGRVWTFAYDANKNLTGVTYPQVDGQTYTRTFGYDANNNITSETDLRGKNWSCTYDSSNRLQTWSNPLNHTVTYTYAGSYTTYSLPVGGVVKHNYSAGQIRSEVDPNFFTVNLGYDASRNLNSVTDKRGGVWYYTYDTVGNVLTERDPITGPYGLVDHTYTYNVKNDILSDTNKQGHIRAYTYNAQGLLWKVDYKRSANDTPVTMLTNTYDSFGQIATSRSGNGPLRTFTINNNGDITAISEDGGAYASAGRSTLGWVTSSTRLPFGTSYYTRDNWGRVTGITNPDASSSSITYDPEDTVTNMVDENGHSSQFGYDDAIRLITSVNGRGDTETYGYNANGWITSVINGRGKTRTYEYTLRGDSKKMTLPDGFFENSSFDGNGNASQYDNSLLRGNQQFIAYGYTPLDAIASINYPNDTDVSFTYDNLRRPYQMLDGTGTTQWGYSDREFLTSLQTPQGNLNYTYDNYGRPTTMVDATGTTTYYYDTYKRPDHITNPHGEITSWDYDSYSIVSRQTKANGSYTTYGYDTSGRLTSLVHKKANNQVISTEGYGYDAAGNMTSKTVDSVTTTFGYDNADQLISESRPGYSATYSYDGNGNRLAKVLNGVTEAYTYDDGDKMLTAGNKVYTYDLAGRTYTVTSPSGTTTCTYDDEDRLVNITGPGLNQNYRYNALDTRVQKLNGSNVVNTYRRNGVSPTAPLLSDGTATFTPGVSERRSGASKFLNTDYLGSTKQITNSSQTTTDTFQYDAFGLQTGRTGTTPTPFGFAGAWGYQSDGTGLQLLGHRYYDPSTGRFLTRDPVKDGRNWYGYCGNNSACGIDPAGLWDVLRCLKQAGARLLGSFVDSCPIKMAYDWYGDMSRNHWNIWDAGAEKRQQYYQFAVDLAHGDEDAVGDALGTVAAAAVTHKLISIAAAPPISEGLGRVKRIDPRKISAPPAESGLAPYGDDGFPLELHHGKKGIEEMTRTDHRLGKNFKKNHPGGKGPNEVDRTAHGIYRKKHWEKRFPKGK